MNASFHLPARSVLLGVALATLTAFTSPSASSAQEGGITAKELASRLSAQQQDGSTFIRLKMDTGGTSLQVQIKSRKTASSTEVVYQILFPKEQKGTGVLLRSSGSGASFTPPDKLTTIEASQMRQPLFGSALNYEDVVQNFFAWENQSFAGTETINKVECHILESKGGKGSYAKVRSWIDLRRMVPMRVEKYTSSGEVALRIDTTDVVQNDGKHIPANLSARRGSTVTELDGSRIKRGVSFTDADFSPEGLKNISAPRGGD